MFRAACRFCTWFQRFNARDTRDAFHYMNSGRAFKSLTNAVSYIFFFFLFLDNTLDNIEIFRTFTNVIFESFHDSTSGSAFSTIFVPCDLECSIDVIIKIKRMIYVPWQDGLSSAVRWNRCSTCICVCMSACVCINHISI